MIGTRIGSALLLTVALVPLLGGGGPDPSVQLAARRLVIDRATRADAALAALERALSPGVDAARQAAALVVTGDDPPGATLRTAASEVESAGPMALAARRALAALEGARRSLGAGSPVQLELGAGDVASVATQLAAAAPAADAFAAMRSRAEGLVGRLEEVLSALDDGAMELARTALAAVRADHDALAAWDVELATLPVWLDTTDAMIGSVEDVVAAAEAGDMAAGLEAAEEFAALADKAAAADRALRIAMGEGGNAVTSAPLSRLADLLRSVATARVQVASIVHAVGR